MESVSTYPNQGNSLMPRACEMYSSRLSRNSFRKMLLLMKERYRNAGCLYQEFSYYGFQGNSSS